jgi:hypothetical protein
MNPGHANPLRDPREKRMPRIAGPPGESDGARI